MRKTIKWVIFNMERSLLEPQMSAASKEWQRKQSALYSKDLTIGESQRVDEEL